MKIRWIPEGSRKIASTKSASVVYLYARFGRICAVGYRGAAATPAFNFRYGSEERRMAAVSTWLQEQDAGAARKAGVKAEKRAALAKPHGLELGAVLYGSWGYDQTNVEFWQVTALKGKRTVEIRELCAESQATGDMTGNAVPLKDCFTNREPAIRRVSESDCVKLYSFGCYLRKAEGIKVDGKVIAYSPKSWTAYA